MACALWGQSDIPPDSGLTGGIPRPPGFVSTTASRAKLGDAGVVTFRSYSSKASDMNRRYLVVEVSKDLGPVRSWGIDKGGVRVLSFTPSTALRIQAESTDQTVAAFDDLAKTPDQYTFAVETMAGTTFRGALRPVRRAVVMAVMSPSKEVPAITNLTATATGAVIAEVTRNESGTLETASLRFDVNFGFAVAATLTGMHVHNGAEGVNGPVILDSGLRLPEGTAPAVRRGSTQLTAEMDLTRSGVPEAVEALLVDPDKYYLNLHTTANPSGAVRGQLRTTEVAPYQIGCSLAGNASKYFAVDGQRTYYLLRNPNGGLDGAVHRRVVLWNNFPAGYSLDGEFPVSTGPGNGVWELEDTADSGLVQTEVLKTLRTFDAGLNVFKSKLDGYGCQSREEDYASDTAGGADGLRIDRAVSGADFVTTVAAPGSLLTLFGQFLRSPSSTPSSAYNQSWPLEANSMEITIGDEKTEGCVGAAVFPACRVVSGRRMPIGVVRKDQINVQVPLDTPPGKYPVRVWNRANGREVYYSKVPSEVEVVAAAPAIFGTSSAPTIVGANGALVGGTNAAKAGDVLTIYASGLGQTNPPSVTGRPAPEAAPTVASVTVLFGTGTVSQLAQTAEALPGSVGVYTVRVTVPTGAGTGPQAVRLRIGTRDSRPVTIPML